jgi:hypothetical protein
MPCSQGCYPKKWIWVDSQPLHSRVLGEKSLAYSDCCLEVPQLESAELRKVSAAISPPFQVAAKQLDAQGQWAAVWQP